MKITDKNRAKLRAEAQPGDTVGYGDDFAGTIRMINDRTPHGWALVEDEDRPAKRVDWYWVHTWFKQKKVKV